MGQGNDAPGPGGESPGGARLPDDEIRSDQTTRRDQTVNAPVWSAAPTLTGAACANARTSGTLTTSPACLRCRTRQPERELAWWALGILGTLCAVSLVALVHRVRAVDVVE